MTFMRLAPVMAKVRTTIAMPNVIEITDDGAPELDVYARLTENQLVNRADPEN